MMMSSVLHKAHKTSKNSSKSTPKVWTSPQIEVDWKQNPVSWSSPQHKSHVTSEAITIMLLKVPRELQDNCQVNTQRWFIPPDQLSLCTVITHFAVLQETHREWQPRPTNFRRVFSHSWQPSTSTTQTQSLTVSNWSYSCCQAKGGRSCWRTALAGGTHLSSHQCY